MNNNKKLLTYCLVNILGNCFILIFLNIFFWKWEEGTTKPPMRPVKVFRGILSSSKFPMTQCWQTKLSYYWLKRLDIEGLYNDITRSKFLNSTKSFKANKWEIVFIRLWLKSSTYKITIFKLWIMITPRDVFSSEIIILSN